MRRLLVFALVAASILRADQVWVTEHGQKTYHTHRDCIALERSRTVLVAEEKEAQAHGLVLCGICAHRKHMQTIRKDNRTWAKPEGASK